MAKVDLASTIAAVLAFAQASAEAVGVLAVWTSAAGLIDIPSAERVAVGIVTIPVALALAVGCARVLSGRSARVLVLAAGASLVISGYWLFLRPPVEGFPFVASAYAVLPALSLALLAVSAARSASGHPLGATAADAPTGPATSTADQRAGLPAEAPGHAAEESAWA